MFDFSKLTFQEKAVYGEGEERHVSYFFTYETTDLDVLGKGFFPTTLEEYEEDYGDVIGISFDLSVNEDNELGLSAAVMYEDDDGEIIDDEFYDLDVSDEVFKLLLSKAGAEVD